MRGWSISLEAHPAEVLGMAVAEALLFKDVQARGGAGGNRRPADWMEGLGPVPRLPADDGDDGDGMDDDRELGGGLDPTDGSDHSSVLPSGYTAIKEYINGLADALIPSGSFADGFESGDTTAWTGAVP